MVYEHAFVSNYVDKVILNKKSTLDKFALNSIWQKLVATSKGPLNVKFSIFMH